MAGEGEGEGARAASAEPASTGVLAAGAQAINHTSDIGRHRAGADRLP